MAYRSSHGHECKREAMTNPTDEAARNRVLKAK
jgi:hypothetical protein